MKRRMGTDVRAVASGIGVLGFALASSCVLIEPYDDPAPDPTSTSTASGGGATTTTSTATSGGGGVGGHGGMGGGGKGGADGGGGMGGLAQGGGGAGPGGSGGTGGTGGTGGAGQGGSGGGPACNLGDTMPCYTGPAGTQSVGVCADGVATCDNMGNYGPCVGEVLPTTEDCATSADEDCDGSAGPPCPGGRLAAARFGDVGSQAGQSIDVDVNGDVVVVGKLGGSADFGGGVLTSAGGTDAFVTKLDSNFGHKWSKRYGDASDQAALSVASDSAGNILVAGDFLGNVDLGLGALASAGLNDMFLAKLDASGNPVWTKRFGSGAEDHVGAVAVDTGDNVILVGYFGGAIAFGGSPLISAGAFDVCVTKLTSNGTHLWSLRIGDAVEQRAHSVAIDAAGNVYVAGRFAGTVTFGATVLTSAGADDIFLMKVDGAGNIAWAKRFGGGLDGDVPGEVTVDAAGNVIITGQFKGVADFGAASPLMSPGLTTAFLAKYDAAGAHLFSKSFGDTMDQGGVAVVTNAQNDVFVAATNFGTIPLGAGVVSAGSSDIFLGRFDLTLTSVWAEGFGDPLAQAPTDLAMGPLGNLYMTGIIAGDVAFGETVLTGGADQDIFVAKFAP